MTQDLMYEQMQNICLKHCVRNLIQPELQIPEQICLSRCSFKYKEAIEFGMEIFRFHEAFIQKTAMQIEKQKEYQQQLANKQNQYKEQFYEILGQKK